MAGGIFEGVELLRFDEIARVPRKRNGRHVFTLFSSVRLREAFQTLLVDEKCFAAPLASYPGSFHSSAQCATCGNLSESACERFIFEGTQMQGAQIMASHNHL